MTKEKITDRELRISIIQSEINALSISGSNMECANNICISILALGIIVAVTGHSLPGALYGIVGMVISIIYEFVRSDIFRKAINARCDRRKELLGGVE